MHLGERILSWLGRYQLRCKDCQHRFAARVWKLADLRYARCPKCYRMDLSTWTEEHYLPKFVTLTRLRLGAKRLRCEYCRFNFAGFRPVKQRYKRKRSGRSAPVEGAEKVTVD